MRISIVPDSFQTLPLSPTESLDSFQRDNKGSANTNNRSESAKDDKQLTVDTVNISYQTPLAAAEANKKGTNTEDTSRGSNSSIPVLTIAKVQFVYNPKGNLSIIYMDTSSRLIYQTPSKLMLQWQESAAKSEAAVDTNA